LTRGHHAAMAYADVPAFVAQLRERKPSPRWRSNLHFDGGAFRRSFRRAMVGNRSCGQSLDVPAERMKAAREHRIPLSDRALAILEKLSEARTGDLVFPGQRAGRPLSVMAMEMLLRRMDQDAVTVHGFRSAFRDWAGNETHFPREVAERRLLTSSAQGRTSLSARRCARKAAGAMSAWASHCGEPDAGSNVVPLVRGTPRRPSQQASVVVADAGLVHARRNDPFLQGVVGRRAQQRAGLSPVNHAPASRQSSMIGIRS